MQSRKVWWIDPTMLVLAWLAMACVDTAAPIPGIGPVGAVQIVSSGHIFTEGPADDGAGGLYFSDLNSEKVFRLSRSGDVSTAIEESRRANGLMLDPGENRLVICESGAKGVLGISRLVALDRETGKVEELSAGYQGRAFNRLNDLVIDREGGIYFSDIVGGKPDLPQPRAAVYYRAPGGAVSRLIDDLPQPNGVLLSPNEQTLYVLPFGRLSLMAYPITGPGELGQGVELSDLPEGDGDKKFGGDGMTVDEYGHIYVALPFRKAIVVIAPTGETLGLISVPERPSNAAFGGDDGKTLFVTARTSVYAFPMAVRGHGAGRSASKR